MDVRRIGIRMPRFRYQRGTLRVVGKRIRKWQGEWYVYLWRNGTEIRRRRKRILGNFRQLSKGQAQVLLDELIAAAGSHAIGDDRPTVGLAYLRLHASKVGQWSDNQRSTVESIWKNHIAPTWSDVPLHRLERQRIQEWLNSVASDGLSQSLLDKMRVYFAAIVRLAKEDGLCVSNPLDKVVVPKATHGRRGAAYLPLESARDLIRAAGTLRDRVILRLLIQAGLRPQEVFVLRADDLDAENSRLRVDEVYARNKVVREGKTRQSLGWVAIPKSLAEEIDELNKHSGARGSDFIFESTRIEGRPATSNAWLRSVLQPIAKKVGIAQIDLRILRRSNATHISHFAGVKAAQTQLRHSRPDMTLLHYIGEEPAELRQAIESIDDQLKFD